MKTTSWSLERFHQTSAVVHRPCAHVIVASVLGARGKQCAADEGQMTLFYFDSLDRELRGSRGRAPGTSGKHLGNAFASLGRQRLGFY